MSGGIFSFPFYWNYNFPRTSAGRLHLLPDVGKIPLVDATLIEDPSESGNDDEESLCSATTQNSNLSVTDPVNANNRDFKIIVDGKSGQRHSIHLVAPTAQDKEAWISDISQCLDNIHMHSLLSPGIINAGKFWEYGTEI